MQPPPFSPYAPPAVHDLDLPGAGPFAPNLNVPLYTARHVTIATFFGTPLGGAVLMALNERRLGRPSAAVGTLCIGVVAAAVLMGVAFALPQNFPSAPLGLASIFAMRYAAQTRQGEAVMAHTVGGGKTGSGWAAFGIGVGCCLVVLVPVSLIVFAATLANGG